MAHHTGLRHKTSLTKKKSSPEDRTGGYKRPSNWGHDKDQPKAKKLKATTEAIETPEDEMESDGEVSPAPPDDEKDNTKASNKVRKKSTTAPVTTVRHQQKKQKKLMDDELPLSENLEKGEGEVESRLKPKKTTKSAIRRKDAITYRGIPDGQRSTAEALKETRKKRFRIVQFGGATGNTAGDAALISLKSSRRRAVIDVGKQEGQWGALVSELTTIKKPNPKEDHMGDPEDSDHSEADTASEGEEEQLESSPGGAMPGASTSTIGKSEQADVKPATTTEPQPSKQLLIITHWHDDHAGPTTKKQTLWDPTKENIATHLRDDGAAKEEQFPTLVYGQRPPLKKHEDLTAKMLHRQVTQGDKKEIEKQLFAWKTTPGKQKREEPPPGELRVEGHAILPPAIKELKPTAQNTESLGVLTLVERSTDTGDKERLFTMVSLGDMEGEAGQGKTAIAKVVGDVQARYCKGIPVDVVKISHHGSDNNLHVVPEGLITKDTTLIISGYTGKDTKNLVESIEGWKPKQVIVLFQDARQPGDLKSNAWDKFQALTPKPVLANSLVMTVGDDGKVEIEATKL